MSLARQNLSPEAEEAINRQILTEFTASYNYLSMSSWLSRDTVALHGLGKFYRQQHKEEYEHGLKLLNYLTKRGGRLVLHPVPAPEMEWKSAMNILETTLKMEKDVNQSLLNLTKIAEQQEDEELSDFICSEFLHDQIQDIKRAADFITQLNLAGGTGLGLYIFDKNIGEQYGVDKN